MKASARARTVLMLGLPGGPNRKMPAALGGGPITPEMVASMLAEQEAKFKAAGVKSVLQLVDPKDADVLQKVKDKVLSDDFDVISIGAGARMDPDKTELFEQLVNIVHQHAPGARLAFDVGPQSLYDTIMRQLPALAEE
mmetsp:Transcript_60930/g.145202  ORF Transcript_60930/g.145202 Transcript_60930/m.145202 type:complete len:139 (+) Transcript_60930:69-485(+)